MVAVCGSYLLICGKTSNMQLSKNSLSLQAIWLAVNWSMNHLIYSMSRWLIFFYCCIWHTFNCFSFLLNIMFAFMLHSEYTTSCFMAKSAKRFSWFMSQASRTDVSLFCSDSHFFQPSEWKYVLFVCFKYLLFLAFLTLWLEISSPHSWSIEGKSCFATHSTIFADTNQNYFSRTLPTAKIKIREK